MPVFHRGQKCPHIADRAPVNGGNDVRNLETGPPGGAAAFHLLDDRAFNPAIIPAVGRYIADGHAPEQFIDDAGRAFGRGAFRNGDGHFHLPAIAQYVEFDPRADGQQADPVS